MLICRMCLFTRLRSAAVLAHSIASQSDRLDRTNRFHERFAFTVCGGLRFHKPVCHGPTHPTVRGGRLGPKKVVQSTWPAHRSRTFTPPSPRVDRWRGGFRQLKGRCGPCYKAEETRSRRPRQRSRETCRGSLGRQGGRALAHTGGGGGRPQDLGKEDSSATGRFKLPTGGFQVQWFGGWTILTRHRCAEALSRGSTGLDATVSAVVLEYPDPGLPSQG